MHFVPAPTFVLICQLGVSAAVVKICDMLGYLEADKFEWDKVRMGTAAWGCMHARSIDPFFSPMRFPQYWYWFYYCIVWQR